MTISAMKNARIHRCNLSLLSRTDAATAISSHTIRSSPATSTRAGSSCSCRICAGSNGVLPAGIKSNFNPETKREYQESVHTTYDCNVTDLRFVVYIIDKVLLELTDEAQEEAGRERSGGVNAVAEPQW